MLFSFCRKTDKKRKKDREDSFDSFQMSFIFGIFAVTAMLWVSRKGRMGKAACRLSGYGIPERPCKKREVLFQNRF